jgi:hypothetical protein
METNGSPLAIWDPNGSQSSSDFKFLRIKAAAARLRAVPCLLGLLEAQAYGWRIGALRSLSAPSIRAKDRHEHFIRFTGHSFVRLNAADVGSPGVAFVAFVALLALITGRPLRTRWTLGDIAFVALLTFLARDTLWALRSLRSCRSLRACDALDALGSLWPCGTLGSGVALWAGFSPASRKRQRHAYQQHGKRSHKQLLKDGCQTPGCYPEFHTLRLRVQAPIIHCRRRGLTTTFGCLWVLLIMRGR